MKKDKDDSLLQVLKEGFSHKDPNRFSLKTFMDGRMISTVELATMHRGGMKYETCVFHCDGKGEITDWSEIGGFRYETEEQAVSGHREVTGKYLRKMLLDLKNKMAVEGFKFEDFLP